MTDNMYTRALAGMTSGFMPLDPANSTRADEIDGAALFEPERPAPEHCPYCGAELVTSPILDGEGNVIVWNIRPDPCKNPDCVRREAERVRKMHEREAAEKRRQQMANAEAALAQIIGTSGFTAQDTALKTFARFERRDINDAATLRACMRYVSEFGDHLGDVFNPETGDGMGLYIHGGYGAGKTHLAKAVGVALREQMYGGIVYRSGGRLFRDIKATFGRSGTSERDVVDVFSSCNLLILDDLEKGRANEWVLEQLYDIIDARYQTMRPVIIVSNKPLEELCAYLGSGSESSRDNAEAIMDRLAERTTTLVLTGDSYRRQTGA